MRAAAEKMSQEVSAFATELSLNRQVYDALAALDARSGRRRDHATTSRRTLRDFRLAGVDKDDATRDADQGAARRAGPDRPGVRAQHPRGRAHRSQVQAGRARRAARRTTSTRHKPGADGKITLDHRLPRLRPGHDVRARATTCARRMYIEYQNRAYPEEHGRARPHDRSSATSWRRCSGFPNWADYITADKMIGQRRRPRATFIDRIVAASGDRARSATTSSCSRASRRTCPAPPASTSGRPATARSWCASADYDFDSQSVRPYFPYDRVKQGVLDVTSQAVRRRRSSR